MFSELNLICAEQETSININNMSVCCLLQAGRLAKQSTRAFNEGQIEVEEETKRFEKCKIDLMSLHNYKNSCSNYSVVLISILVQACVRIYFCNVKKITC